MIIRETFLLKSRFIIKAKFFTRTGNTKKIFWKLIIS